MTTTPKGQINAPDQLDCMSTLRTDNTQTLVNALAEIERLKAELADAEATVGLSGAECERHIQEVDASREAIERLEAINEVNADTLNAMQVEIEQRDAVIERQSAALRQVLTILEEEYVMPDEIETAIITIKEAL